MIGVSDEIGYAAAALLEPWACVEAAYTQRRRLDPRDGGTMWIIGRPDDSATYEASRGLDAPSRIVLTDVTGQVAALVESSKHPYAEMIVADGVTPDTYMRLVTQLTDGAGFDGIVVLDPRSGIR